MTSLQARVHSCKSRGHVQPVRCRRHIHTVKLNKGGQGRPRDESGIEGCLIPRWGACPMTEPSLVGHESNEGTSLRSWRGTTATAHSILLHRPEEGGKGAACKIMTKSNSNEHYMDIDLYFKTAIWSIWKILAQIDYMYVPIKYKPLHMSLRGLVPFQVLCIMLPMSTHSFCLKMSIKIQLQILRPSIVIIKPFRQWSL